MALKLANDNEKNEGARSVEQNPWDYDDVPVRETSIRSSFDNEVYIASVSRSKGDTNIIVVLGRILVYIAAILFIGAAIWCATQNKVDVTFNILKLKWAFTLSNVICFVDAILVNVLYERKITLIVLAWLLPFLYPFKRDQHVNDSGGIGALMSLGMTIALVCVCAVIFSSVTTYSGIAMIEDDYTRAIAAEVFDQGGTQGTSLGARISNNVAVSDVQVVTKGTKTVVVFEGLGRHYIGEEGILIESGNMVYDTQLAFVKNASGQYVLSGVVLGNKQMNSQFVSDYSSMMLNQ